MDGSQFDRLARVYGVARSRRAVTALLGGLVAAPILATVDVDARKKHKRKKTCAKKCPNGCCTGKNGSCIQPAQQSQSVCGTGGEICRSTGCPECTASLPCPTGQCCRGNGTCGACLVFVSSSGHTGNLGNLGGGDAICQNLARAAGLPGTYLAWLSTSGGSPSTRFTRATVPYTLVDGTVIANSWTDLTDGSLLHAVNKTESGATPPFLETWTDTAFTGAVLDNAENCADWTSSSTASQAGVSGATNSVTRTWTANLFSSCDTSNAIYCFQQR